MLTVLGFGVQNSALIRVRNHCIRVAPASLFEDAGLDFRVRFWRLGLGFEDCSLSIRVEG